MSDVVVTRKVGTAISTKTEEWKFSLVQGHILVLETYSVQESSRHKMKVLYSRGYLRSPSADLVPFPEDVQREALLKFVLSLEVSKDYSYDKERA